MRLDCFDQYAMIAEFDPLTGSVSEARRDEALKLAIEPVCGHYARLAGSLVILYRHGADLRLRVGDRDVVLREASVGWRSEGRRRTITVSAGGSPIEVAYEAPPDFEFDFTAGVDEEDSDFGLFLVNVANDSDRASRMYRAD